MSGRRLCRIAEIDEDGGKGFVFGEGTARREIFLVRVGNRVYGYENACPHHLRHPRRTLRDRRRLLRLRALRRR